METITLPAPNAADFAQARKQAVGKANEMLSKPVIIAWKDDQANTFAPAIPGGVGDRWHDYGESNGGKLELQVGDTFHFIFSEAEDFEEPDLNIASIPGENGSSFLCLNNTCTDEDRQHLGYFPGGGLGG